MKLMKLPTLLTGLLIASLAHSEDAELILCHEAIDCLTVYGRLQEETQIEIPVAETFFSTQQIENIGIERVKDFIHLTPNMTLTQTQSIGTSFLSIRGMTQVRNSEMPVAVVVDDVQQINARQFTQNLLDIESIEVIKGPQGALYGRNATGGAFVMRTRPPSEELSGLLRVGTGNGGRQHYQAGLSGPVNDELAFRVSALDTDFDGLIDNVYLDKEVDYFDESAFRGVLSYAPSDNIEMTLTGKHSSFEGGGLNYVYQPAVLADDGMTLASGSFPFDFTQMDANDTSREISANNLGYNERDITELSMKLRVFTDHLEWLSITSYAGLEEFTSGDQYPYTAATTRNTSIGNVDGTQSQYVDIDSWSQEFRVISEQENSTWMLGAYYLETDRYISTTTGDDTGRGIIRIEETPDFNNPINPTLSFFGDDNDNEAWAVYGNVTYDVTEALELAAALRYDEDKREQHVSIYNSGGTPGGVNRVTFDQWQPKFSVRYLFAEQMSLFASWGKGFRSGQFNQNGVAAAAAQAGINGVKDIADKEVSESFEVGYKGYFETLDLTLTANVFHTDVSGQQYFVFIGAVGAQVLTNIDDVRLLGGELGIHKYILEDLAITLDYGYVDSEIKKYAVDPSLEGNRAPYIPRSTLNLGIEYLSGLTQSLDLLLRADYEKIGRQYWSPENTQPRDSIELVNFRIGLSTKDKQWTLTSSLKNAFDEEYNSEYVSGGFAYIAPPRQWTMDLTYQF